MATRVKKLHKKKWYEGPKFKYCLNKTEEITVNVTGSSWLIKGLRLSRPVLEVFELFKHTAKTRILDFGAGTWLRYSKKVYEEMPNRELYLVEYRHAFQNKGEKVLNLYDEYNRRATIWTPKEFISRKRKNDRFDLIFLVNVFNTIPEVEHREAIFKVLAKRLHPSGLLVVYQRIWSSRENPSVCYEYNDGWIIPQTNYSYYTYRANTGAIWFNRMARSYDLRIFQIPFKMKSKNTLFKIWEKMF